MPWDEIDQEYMDWARGRDARRRAASLYVFRCMRCNTEWPSDGQTQQCPKCLREWGDGWTKQEIVSFPNQ